MFLGNILESLLVFLEESVSLCKFRLDKIILLDESYSSFALSVVIVALTIDFLGFTVHLGYFGMSLFKIFIIRGRVGIY